MTGDVERKERNREMTTTGVYAARARGATRVDLDEMIAKHEISCFDFGSSNGNSMAVAERIWGAHCAGIDIDTRKIAKAKEQNRNVVFGDILNLDVSDNCVKGVLMNHVLEHLPGKPSVIKAMDNAIRVSQQTIVVRQPYFDMDPTLMSLGLKFYWSHWTGHQWNGTTFEFATIMQDFIRQQKLERGIVLVHDKIENGTESDTLQAMNASIDSLQFDASKHPKKPHFDKIDNLFRETIAIGFKSAEGSDEELSRIARSVAPRGFKIVFDSNVFE